MPNSSRGLGVMLLSPRHRAALGVRTLVSLMDFVFTVLVSPSNDHKRSAQKFTLPLAFSICWWSHSASPTPNINGKSYPWLCATAGSVGQSVEQPWVPQGSQWNNTRFIIFFSQINPRHFRLAGELLFYSVLLLRPLKSQGNLNTKSLF